MSSSSPVVPLEMRVNLLFATVIDGEGTEVSTAVVAAALSASTGRPVTPAEIDTLRRLDAVCPDGDLLRHLAEYFDMPASFLSDRPDRYYSAFRQLSLLITQRDKRIPFVALRSSSDRLGDNALQELTDYLDSLGG